MLAMAIHPSDLGDGFVRSGRRLITQPSSDALLNKLQLQLQLEKSKKNQQTHS